MRQQFAVGLALAVALVLSAPGAFAFSQSNGPSSVDLKATNRLADPDDLMSDMTAQSSGATRSYSFGNA